MGRKGAKDEATKKATTAQNKERMLKALIMSNGVITRACAMANVERTTHYGWRQTDPEYNERVNEVNEMAIDFAETALFNQIKEENITAIIFYLKTKGKVRGYVEKTEQEVAITKAPQINIVLEQD